MNNIRYRVTISSHGSDCDGPIDHGTRTEIMSHKELMTQLGYLTFGHSSIEHTHDAPGIYSISFYHKHDEGFSRTYVTMEELEYYADDDRVAGYSVTNGEPVYR